MKSTVSQCLSCLSAKHRGAKKETRAAAPQIPLNVHRLAAHCGLGLVLGAWAWPAGGWCLVSPARARGGEILKWMERRDRPVLPVRNAGKKGGRGGYEVWQRRPETDRLVEFLCAQVLGGGGITAPGPIPCPAWWPLPLDAVTFAAANGLGRVTVKVTAQWPGCTRKLLHFGGQQKSPKCLNP